MGDFSLQTWSHLLMICYKAYSSSLKEGSQFIWQVVFTPIIDARGNSYYSNTQATAAGLCVSVCDPSRPVISNL